MKAFQTHYDNLMVARNAPPEVITAAYRQLSLKYHPDRNPGDANAQRVMSIINASYAVLSDPARRSEHDLWIDERARRVWEEAAFASAREIDERSSSSVPSRDGHPLWNRSVNMVSPLIDAGRIIGLHPIYTLLLLFMAVIALFGSLRNAIAPGKPEPVQTEMANTQPPVIQSEFVRPATAPNGSPWPRSAAYLGLYPRLRANGLSTVTVDNSANGSDVFVKLTYLGGTKPKPVRHIYIPAWKTFTMRNVEVGRYDVRYEDLSDGEFFRTDSFDLRQVNEQGGTRYSATTLTLYKVPNGNMETHSLSSADFSDEGT